MTRTGDSRYTPPTTFTMHLDTWGDSILHSATASWTAYPVGRLDILSGEFSTTDLRQARSSSCTTVDM